MKVRKGGGTKTYRKTRPVPFQKKADKKREGKKNSSGLKALGNDRNIAIQTTALSKFHEPGVTNKKNGGRLNTTSSKLQNEWEARKEHTEEKNVQMAETLPSSGTGKV